MQFKQTNLLNNETFIGNFNLSHHWCFNDDYGVNTQRLQASLLIKKWNLQQPLNWKYELVENVKYCNGL